MGLQVNETEQSVPSLSRLHLSSILPTETELLFVDLEEVITKENGEDIIKGANDTFILERPSNFSMGKLTEAISSVLPSSAGGNADESSSDGTLDYNKVAKRIVVHWEGPPAAKETPYFNHAAYFSNFAQYVRDTNGTEGWFGKHILYGEVVTSTSTMLEK
jgi:biotin--protein ligase